MRALLRFLGFRRVAATWLALALMLAVRLLLSSPPEGWESWPYAASRSAAHFVRGSYQIAYALWVAAAIGPLRWFVPLRFDDWFRAASLGVTALGVASGGWLVIKGVGALCATPAGYHGSVLEAVFWAACIPLGFGLLPLAWIEACEHIRTWRFVARWFRSGRGSHAAWIAPYALHRITRPIPRRL